MSHVNDDTEIVADNSSKEVTNFSIRPTVDGFDLLFFNAVEVAGDQVTKAEIVAQWHFDSLTHLRDITEKISDSVLKHYEQ